MEKNNSWDFRNSEEVCISDEYNDNGYIIRDAKLEHLELIKEDIESAYRNFAIAKEEIQVTLKTLTI